MNSIYQNHGDYHFGDTDFPASNRDSRHERRIDGQLEYRSLVVPMSWNDVACFLNAMAEAGKDDPASCRPDAPERVAGFCRKMEDLAALIEVHGEEIEKLGITQPRLFVSSNVSFDEKSNQIIADRPQFDERLLWKTLHEVVAAFEARYHGKIRRKTTPEYVNPLILNCYDVAISYGFYNFPSNDFLVD